MGRSANERYHDRVAPRYEEQHESDPYLSFCRELTWRHLKRFLPRDAGAAVLDAGCGPGHFGVKLSKSGYAVDFVDLSEGMLERARRHHAEAGGGRAGIEPRFLRASLDDDALAGTLGAGRYALVLALGDVLSFVPDPARALRVVRNLLAPGGVFVASVDQRYAGVDYLLEKGDLTALDRFLRDGRTEWLAKEKSERFPTRMFAPREVEKLCRDAGFAIESLIGRPVLPLSRQRDRLLDKEARRKLLAIEEREAGERDLLSRASHLEFAVRRPAE